MVKKVLLIFAVFILFSCVIGCSKHPVITTYLPQNIYLSHYNQRPYTVAKEIDIHLGELFSGILGIPTSKPPDINAIVQGEIHSVRGDAVMDLDIQYDWKMVYLFIGYSIYPRYHITGKVIRYE